MWSGVVGSATDPTAALWQAPATWRLAQVVEMGTDARRTALRRAPVQQSGCFTSGQKGAIFDRFCIMSGGKGLWVLEILFFGYESEVVRVYYEGLFFRRRFCISVADNFQNAADLNGSEQMRGHELLDERPITKIQSILGV